MERVHGFDFQPIEIDRRGKLRNGADELAAHVKEKGISDVVLICHGFRNDENDARALYSRFLMTLDDNRKNPALAARLGSRTFAIGGVFWPSMIFPESDDSQGAALSTDDTTQQNRARLEAMRSSLDAPAAKKLDDLLEHVDSAPEDGNARLAMAHTLLELVRELKGDEENELHTALREVTPAQLCDALMAEMVVLAVPDGGDGGAPTIPQIGTGGQVDVGVGLGFFGKMFGFVPKFLNLTTFLLMFNRCGDVGADGINQTVRKLKEAANTRVHLVGHSLGGRAVTACAQALLQEPAVQIDSMMLLQAAFSHFGLSAGATPASPIQHPRGHFRDVIEKKAVKGPILATHSEHDSVVAKAYTPMAVISGNNARAIGDHNSPFGGIGRNGVLDTRETKQLELNTAGVAYNFDAGWIYNLNGSRKTGDAFLINSHGDVTSPAITWAFASLVATTR